MITFNNIVERFEIFAENHFFIKSFSFGSPDDVDLSKFTSFPLMHLVYTGATYDAGTKTYNLEVYILDVPADKNSKELRQKEVVSDAEQCAEDIIADIKNGGNIFLFAQDYEVVNATTTPLEEETKNVLSGVLLDLSVSIPYEWDACNAPINGVEPGGTEITYARRGVLRMLTLDGATDVTSVRTIKVTNGTLTDDGDGVVTLDTGGVETLEDLTDTNIINVQGGDVITWNSGVSKWMVSDGLQTLLSLLKSQSGTQLYNTSLDTDKGYIDLQATTAKMGLGQSFLKVTQTSPGVLTFSIACGAEGAETEFEAFKLQGTTTAGVADLLIQSGCRFKLYDANGYEVWIRPSGGMTGNVTLVTPATGGTLALQSEIPTSVTDLSDVTSAGSGAIITTAERDAIGGIPAGGTTGQALIKTSGTDYDTEWADISIDVQYHNRYQTTAASLRAGATATTELYYTAQADGDGYAESASSDTPTAGYDIQRKLYYSEAAFADPDTGTWIQFAAIADNTTFANAKAALLAYLKDRTGGTVPISLKQTWEEVQQAPSFTGLLNESYGSGAAAAYSTRRLNGNVTECMVIRRASDSTTQTIGFDANGNIDEAAINTFCSGTTCTVETWKDQSGNGYDATQTTPANQPTIYTGGAIVKENGKPAVDFDANTILNTSVTNAGTFDSFNVIAIDGGDTRVILLSDIGGSNASYLLQSWSGNTSAIVSSNAFSVSNYYQNGVSQTFTNRGDAFIKLNGQQNLLVTDGSLTTAGAIGIAYNGIAGYKSQELIFYATDKSSVRTQIESNIGDYFTQNTPLLDTYSGAAAAYSLRKLRTAYTGSAIRVRRANDNAESDINFNVFGELDTVSLASFCSGTNGFVKTWYDQSGSTNDATQTTAANQPKIYDSVTGVVKDSNGDITLDGDATTLTYMSLATSINLTTNYSFVMAGDFVNGDRTSGGGSYQFLVLTQTSQTVARSNISDAILTTWATGSTGSKILSVNMDSSSGNFNLRMNGADTNQTANTATYTISDIFYYGNATLWTKGSIKEIVVYDSSKYSDRTNIEDNLNTFYNVY